MIIRQDQSGTHLEVVKTKKIELNDAAIRVSDLILVLDRPTVKALQLGNEQDRRTFLDACVERAFEYGRI
jgi:hypothetical protein